MPQFVSLLRGFGRSIRSAVKRRWKLLLLLVVLLGGGGFFWYQKQRSNVPVLVFERPETEDLTQFLEVSGLVDAKEKASLRFAAGGKIVYLGAYEGDTVRKWQTIATIDQRDLQKRLKKDLNAYMTERWDWEQTLDDTKDRALPKSEQRDREQEQWTLDDTVLDVEIRDIAIQNTVLSAPFEGVLVTTPVTTPGVQILATEAFELVNPNTLVFRAAVDEADIAQVKIGQKAFITLDAYPDQPLETYVRYLAYKSSQGSSGTTFIVELPVIGENLLDRYRLDMNGDVKITLETHPQVMTIPYIALREHDGQSYVAVRTGETTYEERAIEIGLETEEKVEVLSGLTSDDEILIPQQEVK